jgi:hypothetical protein
MSQVLGARYRLLLPGGDEEAARLGERIAGILGGASLPFERRTGKSRGLLELRPSLQRMEIVGREGRDIVVHLETHRREGVLARPRDLLELLGHEASGAIVRKLDVLVEAMDRGDAAAEALQLVPLSERWPFPWERAVEPV